MEPRARRLINSHQMRNHAPRTISPTPHPPFANFPKIVYILFNVIRAFHYIYLIFFTLLIFVSV